VKISDPELAATFVEQPSVTVKGISTAVRIYEVPWKEANIGIGALGTGTAKTSETSTMLRPVS
jgi:hypothetical protein